MAPGAGETGVEHIGVDHLARPLQAIERWADGLEERAAVIAARRPPEGEVELPFADPLQALHEVLARSRRLPHLCDRCAQQLVVNGSALCRPPEGLEACLAVEAENFPATDGDDLPALVGFDPAKRRIHQQRRHLAAAVRLGHGQKADLEQPPIE